MSDLISREETIARFVGAMRSREKSEHPMPLTEERIVRFLKAMPPTAEPKVGTWIELNKNDDGTHNIQCTYCRQCVKSKGHANSFNTAKHFSYCPHCGAEMRTEF